MTSARTAFARINDCLDSGLALFYPPICQFCGDNRASAAEGFICARCWTQVRFIKPPFCNRCGLPYEGDITTSFECTNCRGLELFFCSARSAVAAGGLILEIMHRYKYQRALWFEPFLADVFLREAAPVLNHDEWDVLVPVPLHPAKQREREFNQAVRVATRLSAATKIPVKENLLLRILPTNTQTLLTREERAANVRRAFAMSKGQRLNKERIVLVDDVFTTGATTNACARVLRAAGADKVCVWTVARGL